MAAAQDEGRLAVRRWARELQQRVEGIGSGLGSGVGLGMGLGEGLGVGFG